MSDVVAGTLAQVATALRARGRASEEGLDGLLLRFLGAARDRSGNRRSQAVIRRYHQRSVARDHEFVRGIGTLVSARPERKRRNEKKKKALTHFRRTPWVHPVRASGTPALTG